MCYKLNTSIIFKTNYYHAICIKGMSKYQLELLVNRYKKLGYYYPSNIMKLDKRKNLYLHHSIYGTIICSDANLIKTYTHVTKLIDGNKMFNYNFNIVFRDMSLILFKIKNNFYLENYKIEIYVEKKVDKIELNS